MLRRIVMLISLLFLTPLMPAVAETPNPPPVIYLPLVGRDSWTGPPRLLLSALYYDTYRPGEPDEAFQLYNPLNAPVPLAGWQMKAGTRVATFPDGLELEAGGWLWCAQQATDFTLTFGMRPACEYGADTDPEVPNMTGSVLQFGNTGGVVALLNPDGTYADLLVYEGGDSNSPGWQGPSVTPYTPTNVFGQEGQILYRKLDQATGRPVADTDTRADWAQDPEDAIDGRKARYAGWDLERFFLARPVTEAATLSVLVSPDNAFDGLEALLQGVQHSIRFEGYTFENARLAELIAARARDGVAVELLLEGAPPGGISDQQRWVVQQIATAGGQVYYIRSNRPDHRRYKYQHAKFWVLDGDIALIGSENINADAFPDDPKSDGTIGRRGVYLMTDAPSIVAQLGEIMDADIAPGVHGDIWTWEASDASLGAPPAGFVPSYDSGGSFYPVQAPQPLSVTGTFPFQLIHAPEQALRDRDSLLGLVNRAGPGDTVLVEQMYEHLYWGATGSNIADDPNPRLEAYLAAARRGATVRVLLDSYFDDLGSPRSNLRTVEYLNATAAAEGLDLQARRRNPTGRGIHNKMVLARIGGRGWVAAGSLNGGEVSAKLNREMVLLVGSDEAYDYLAEVFQYDWDVTP